MVSKDITLKEQKLLIISIILAVFVSQLAYLMNISMFSYFLEVSLLGKIIMILSYMVGIIIFTLALTIVIFKMFDIKIKPMRIKGFEKLMYICGIIFLMLIIIGIIFSLVKWILFLIH